MKSTDSLWFAYMQICLFDLPLSSGDVPHVLNVPNVLCVVHVQHDVHIIWYLILYVLYIEYICVSSHNFQFHVLYLFEQILYLFEMPILILWCSFHPTREISFWWHTELQGFFFYMNRKIRTKLQGLFLITWIVKFIQNCKGSF